MIMFVCNIYWHIYCVCGTYTVCALCISVVILNILQSQMNYDTQSVVVLYGASAARSGGVKV